MSGIVFEPDSARRIAAATRGYEQSLSAPEPTTYEADGSYGRMMLVRTDSSFPTDYTGYKAAGGAVIEKRADGSVKVIATAWLKDSNNNKLKPGFIYQARLSGVYTQNVLINGIETPKTFALYIVQSFEPVIYENFRLVYTYDNSGTNKIIAGVTLSGEKLGYITAYDPSNVFFLLTLNPSIGYTIPYLIYGSGIFFYDEAYKMNRITNYILYPFTFGCWAKFLAKTSYEDYDRISLYNSYYDAIGNQASQFSAQTIDPLGLVRERGGVAKVICQWNYSTGLVIIAANLYLFPSGLPSSGKAYGGTNGIGSGIGSGISGV
jgi:hypothetical protein